MPSLPKELAKKLAIAEHRPDCIPVAPVRPRIRAEQQRSQETRMALLATARRLFGDIGYHATGTNEVVAQARLTRGALYHHFKNKEDLFEAVFRTVEFELAADAQAATHAMRGQTSERAIASLRIYLEILASRRDTQRILLIDGPAVLGWERWREVRSEYEFAGWVQTIVLFSERGEMPPTPAEPMAQIIMGAINEAILTIAHATDRSRALAEMSDALIVMINGIIYGKRV